MPWTFLANDRLSVSEGLDRPLAEALANRFHRGLVSIKAGAFQGAERLARAEYRGAVRVGRPAARPLVPTAWDSPRSASTC